MSNRPSDPNAAIVLRGVTKSFKKRTIRREYTTLKSELVNLVLRRKKKDDEPKASIEALRGIDLVVPRGKTVGILGRNGSGKSTLLKLITGIYAPTAGTIEVGGRISALLDLGAGFHPDFSGRENILINGIILGMSRTEVRDRMDEIIAFSELGEFIDEPVRTYSSGMYMRLAFAVATHVDPDILIIDEILAVGDEHFSHKSMARMTEFKRQGKTIVLVTHDLGAVSRWCDMAAWIDGGRIREIGAPLDVVTHYREAVRLAEASNLSMTPSALTADGGALPSLGGTVSTRPAPVIRGVMFEDAGRMVDALDAQRGGVVVVDFQAAPDSNLKVTLELRTAEDQLLFRTESPVPSGVRVVRLQLEKLPMSSGTYRVVVNVVDGDSSAVGDAAFSLLGAPLTTGPVAVPHRWVMGETSAEPSAVATRPLVSVS